MSVEALTWARRVVAGNVSKKAVLYVLANYADEEWSCFPSQATIAEQAEVGERTVRRILQEWEDDGLIERVHRCSNGRGRTSDRIFINAADWPMRPPKDLPANDDLPATDDDLPATGARPTGQGLADEALEEASVEALTLLAQPEPSRDSVPAAQSKEQIEADFTEWYAEYPRKKKPADARRAYAKARKIATKDELLLGAQMLARLVKNQQQELKFTPYPASWLNGECWREPEETEPPRNPFSGPEMRFG